ncbi:hypothetical protein AKO1_009336, partial [Acrasis kona]
PFRLYCTCTSCNTKIKSGGRIAATCRHLFCSECTKRAPVVFCPECFDEEQNLVPLPYCDAHCGEHISVNCLSCKLETCFECFQSMHFIGEHICHVRTSLLSEKGRRMCDAQEELCIEDAVLYLDLVKRCLTDTPNAFEAFLGALRDFKSNKIDMQDVLELVGQLFQGQEALLEGFNAFLPNKFHVESEQLQRLHRPPLQNISKI